MPGSSNIPSKTIIDSSPLNSSWFVDNPPPPLYAIPARSDSRQTIRDLQEPLIIHVPQIKTYHPQATYNHGYGTRPSSTKHRQVPEIPRSVPPKLEASDITALTDQTSQMKLNGPSQPTPVAVWTPKRGTVRSARTSRKPYDPYGDILRDETVRPFQTLVSEVLREAKKARQSKENGKVKVEGEKQKSRKKSVA